MDSMIERVARAMTKADSPFKGCANFDEEIEKSWFRYVDLAKLAIEAMREPTEGMVDAAYEVKAPGSDLHDFEAYSCAEPVWQAMIDAALMEGK